MKILESLISGNARGQGSEYRWTSDISKLSDNGYRRTHLKYYLPR